MESESGGETPKHFFLSLSSLSYPFPSLEQAPPPPPPPPPTTPPPPPPNAFSGEESQ